MRGRLGRVLLVLVTVVTLGLSSVVPAFAQGLVGKDEAKAACEAIKEAAQEGTEEEKEAAEEAKELCDEFFDFD